MENITQAIVTLLEPLITEGKVKQIEYSGTSIIEGYPKIRVAPTGTESTYLTNRERQIEYIYTITIKQEQIKEGIGSNNAQTRLSNLVQEVIELLDGEINTATPLGGTVDFIRPIESTESQEVAEIGEIMHTLTVRGVKTV